MRNESLHLILKWLARGTAAGLVLSAIVHVIVLLAASQFGVTYGRLGAVGESASNDLGDVDLAIVTDVQLRAMEAQTEELLDISVGETAQEDLDTSVDLDIQDSPDTGATESELGAIVDSQTGSGDIGDTPSDNITGTGDGSTKFFGVEARGARFAYIVDVSGSMAAPREKIVTLRAQLNESIGSLLEHMAFYVVFFETKPTKLAGRDRWIAASDAGKSLASREIEKVDAQGGTNPGPAFEIVLNMKPLPDAIYFMTDGQFGVEVAEQIRETMKRGRRIPIHCIAFVDASAEPLMKKIAKESGGTYTFVPGVKP